MRDVTRSLCFALLFAGCGPGPMSMTDGGGDLGMAPDLAAADARLPDGGAPDLAKGDGGVYMGPKITMCPKAGQPPLAMGTCEVTAGSDAKLITGTILTPGEVLRGGQVLIDAMGKIACVACDCSGGAAGATTINCPTGVVSPALINPHNHIALLTTPGIDSRDRYEQRHDRR